jgi:hypothetical protein
VRALTICVVRELPSEEYSIKVAGNPAGTKNFIHFGLKKNKKDRKIYGASYPKTRVSIY